MKIRAMVTVKGLVQGVNFRYYTRQTASRLGVTGWVRNLPNGDVEGCFEGDGGAVDALIEWCRNGPPAARVDRVDVEKQEYGGQFGGFDVRH